jgi:hypothetical protein
MTQNEVIKHPPFGTGVAYLIVVTGLLITVAPIIYCLKVLPIYIPGILGKLVSIVSAMIFFYVAGYINKKILYWVDPNHQPIEIKI